MTITQRPSSIVIEHIFWYPGTLATTAEFIQISRRPGTAVGEIACGDGRIVAVSYTSQATGKCLLNLWQSNFTKTNHNQIIGYPVDARYFVHYEHDNNLVVQKDRTLSLAAVPQAPNPITPMVKIYVSYPTFLAETQDIVGP